MKKRFLGLLLAVIVIVASLVPTDVQAASYKTKIKKLVANMESYEWMILTSFRDEYDLVDGKLVINFSDTEIAQAAAAAGFKYDEDKILRTEEEMGMWSEIEIPTSVIKSYSKKLFGKKVSYKKLPKQTAEDVKGFLEAYRNENGKAAMYCWEYETETDFVVQKVSVKKNGDTYTCTKDIFCGYWGFYMTYNENDHAERDENAVTHRITYTIEKKKGSAYGYVITEMLIESVDRK